MKQFDIPIIYRSPLITGAKKIRQDADRRKRDFSPTTLDFGDVKIHLARHFGFCYGVENAIEISYRAIDENPDKRIFLLSQMIHNPNVNADLQERGIEFLMDTMGNELIPLEEVTSEDVVIVPAFGTTLEMEEKLSKKGVELKKYNTTCPFVEKVWNRSAKLGQDDYTIIIHGKHAHEETRATFSHSAAEAPSLVVKDMKETQLLGDFMLGKATRDAFDAVFAERISKDFDPERDLSRVGVVNQTTMLASETQAISDHVRGIMIQKYGEEKIREHFADTRDTLCYATNDNQQATQALLNTPADLAIVVGGYNSSNTSHLVELCEEVLPTFYIKTAEEMLSDKLIQHYDFHHDVMRATENYLPAKRPLSVLLTSGASCPDALVEEVLHRILSYAGIPARAEAEVLAELKGQYSI